MWHGIKHAPGSKQNNKNKRANQQDIQAAGLLSVGQSLNDSKITEKVIFFKKGTILARQWWPTPLTTALRGQRQADL